MTELRQAQKTSILLLILPPKAPPGAHPTMAL
jgi:hypothetical protein